MRRRATLSNVALFATVLVGMSDRKHSGIARKRGAASASVVRGRGTAQGGARVRVLVVDDLEDNRDLYATYFEHWGFETDQAADGEEALAKIAKVPPDVVIMDLSMPNVDGWEATRLIKSNPRTSHVIVAVVTGNTTTENVAAAYAAGADAVFSKPCWPKDLLYSVEHHLATRSRKAVSTGRV